MGPLQHINVTLFGSCWLINAFSHKKINTKNPTDRSWFFQHVTLNTHTHTHIYIYIRLKISPTLLKLDFDTNIYVMVKRRKHIITTSLKDSFANTTNYYTWKKTKTIRYQCTCMYQPWTYFQAARNFVLESIESLKCCLNWQVSKL